MRGGRRSGRRFVGRGGGGSGWMGGWMWGWGGGGGGRLEVCGGGFFVFCGGGDGYWVWVLRGVGSSAVWADLWCRVLELSGLARLREALETNDWEGVDGEGLEVGEEEEEGFEAEAAEVEREMLEMRMAVYGAGEGLEDERGEAGVEGEEEDEGQDIQVEELESMMLKMQAIRGTFFQSTRGVF